MAREVVDIRDKHCLGACRGGAAYALPEWDADAGGFALKRTEHQLVTSAKIEAGPVEIRQAVIDQRGHVRGVGYPVRFSGEQGRELRREFDVAIRLVCVHVTSMGGARILAWEGWYAISSTGATNAACNAAGSSYPRCRSDRPSRPRLSPRAVRLDRGDGCRQIDPARRAGSGAWQTGGSWARTKGDAAGGGIG